MAEIRRDKGSGTVRQRKDGRWEGRAPAPYSNKTFYGKSSAEVKKKIKDLCDKVAKEGFLDVERITVDEYLNRYILSIKANELKPRSLELLDHSATHLIHPHIGSVRIGDLKTFDVQKMIIALNAQGYAYSTLAKAYKLIKQAYKYGMNVTPPIVNHDPCRGVILPKNNEIPMSEISVFTDEEVLKICKSAISKAGNGAYRYSNGHAVIVLMFTGLRYGELAGLEWKNVDLENRKLYVRGNAVTVKDRDGDGKYKTILQKTAKTRSSSRTVPLCDDAYNALLHMKERANSEFVLTTKKGTLVEPRNFRRMFSEILEDAGVPHRGVHTCRHTFASMLFKRGVDAKVVSEILGHADVSITYNIYIHVLQEQKDLAVNLLPSMLTSS